MARFGPNLPDGLQAGVGKAWLIVPTETSGIGPLPIAMRAHLRSKGVKIRSSY